MQVCDSTCFHCATNWFRWLKAREAQMKRVLPGHKVSFSDAARTSNIPR